MLSKNALWAKMVSRNPHWIGAGVDFTAAGLLKFYEVVYDTAHKAGVENGKALAAMEKRPNSRPSAIDDIFSRFGEK